MKDTASGELIRLRAHAVLHKSVGIQIHAAAGVFRQRRLQRQNAAEPVRSLFQIGVAKHQVILYKAAECLLAEYRMRVKVSGQNVAFDGNRRAVMHGGAIIVRIKKGRIKRQAPTIKYRKLPPLLTLFAWSLPGRHNVLLGCIITAYVTV